MHLSIEIKIAIWVIHVWPLFIVVNNLLNQEKRKNREFWRHIEGLRLRSVTGNKTRAPDNDNNSIGFDKIKCHKRIYLYSKLTLRCPFSIYFLFKISPNWIGSITFSESKFIYSNSWLFLIKLKEWYMYPFLFKYAILRLK